MTIIASGARTNPRSRRRPLSPYYHTLKARVIRNEIAPKHNVVPAILVVCQGGPSRIQSVRATDVPVL